VFEAGGPGPGPGRYNLQVTTRYRCRACGNLTRFDVVATRRMKEFHHFSVGGELTVEDTELLDERVDRVGCRWCDATGEAIEALPADAVRAPERAP
jgi:hypothetical protein